MTRTLRLTIFAAFLASALMAAAAIALRTGAVAPPAGLVVQDGPPNGRMLFGVLFIPLWSLFGWTMAEWRGRRRNLKPAADFLQTANLGFAAAILFCAVMQAWIVMHAITGQAPGREFMVRLSVVFVGALTAVQGNFLAKSSPPSGEKAPSPAAWTRHVLRIGWGMVLVGLAMLAAGLMLPFRVVVWSGVVGVALLVVNALVSRRGLHRECAGT